ncbi:MAG: SatD family protein [Bacteroidota bacterium]
MKLFAVITGDIIDSKKHPDYLEMLKESLSQIQTPGLYTPFNVSRGDELQAVCDDPSLLPVIIRNLRYVCRPLKIRLGIGIGQIDNPASSANSWDMTGPAFVFARKALDLIKKGKTPQTVLVSEDPFFDRVFNMVYSLADTIMNGWTPRQWEAVQAYEAGRTLIKAAGKLKIAWQNVQKRCQAAKWDVIKRVEEELAVLFGERFINIKINR